MKTPCRNCPFRTDKIFPLNQTRRSQIAQSLFNDADFPCHKTLGDVDQHQPSLENTRRCTGAAIFLEHSRPGGLFSNLSFRLAVMKGEFQPAKLDLNAPVARTRQEFEHLYND